MQRKCPISVVILFVQSCYFKFSVYEMDLEKQSRQLSSGAVLKNCDLVQWSTVGIIERVPDWISFWYLKSDACQYLCTTHFAKNCTSTTQQWFSNTGVNQRCDLHQHHPLETPVKKLIHHKKYFYCYGKFCSK